MANKLQAAWDEYKGHCYPEGMTAEQSKQIHQAFFAGALVLLIETEAVSKLPDDQAVAELGALHNECLAINSARLSAVKARN